MIRFAEKTEGEKLYPGYNVKANGNEIPVYECRVSAMPYNTEWPGCQRPLDQTELAGYISLETDGEVTLTVVCEKDFAEAVVRPLSKGVKVNAEGRTCEFTLPGVGQYTLELDGFHNALHIFADKIQDFSEYLTPDRQVITFPRGQHRIGHMEIQSNTTVYLEPGAVLYGSIEALCAENVSVVGYGTVDGSDEVRNDDTWLFQLDYNAKFPDTAEELREHFERKNALHGCIRFYKCKNVAVEGVIMRDAATFGMIPANCDGVKIQNTKTIGMWKYNSDGIDLFNCANVIIRDCFLRDFDDCIVIKGICGWDLLNNENILVENCVVWCDWGRNLEIGAETNAPEYKNITFRNCDLIHGSTAYMDIQHHNYADIHDIVFENIRAEYTKYQLADVYQHNMSAPYVCPQPTVHPRLGIIPIYHSGLFSLDGKNGRAHDVVFRDIRVLTDGDSIPLPENYCVGTDGEHTVERVTYENFTINGKKYLPQVGRNEFTADITVK